MNGQMSGKQMCGWSDVKNDGKKDKLIEKSFQKLFQLEKKAFIYFIFVLAEKKVLQLKETC